ncbi:MAG: hypothetical protein QM737_03900 [Ferruginibacter sp.]
MKINLLVAILILIPAFIFAQAPQGLNYQAVAYNGSGVPVINQLLGVRLSILDGSATGTLVYQETQGPTSDNTGLFSIVIGNGTVTSGTFSTINWGSGSKWLKTEIDIAGGTSYVAMGTTQFMSVPYALYANMAASSGTFQHPDGLNNITPVQLNDTVAFTVPAGKNLYAAYDYVIVDTFGFVKGNLTNGMDTRPFIGASAGDSVRSEATGFLVDATVEWKTFNIGCTPFTVPAGKIFVIVTSNNAYNSLRPVINGKRLDNNLCQQVLKAGDVITVDTPCINKKYYINGYLRN